MLSRCHDFSETQLDFQRLCRDFVDDVVRPFVGANARRELFRETASLYAGPDAVFNTDGTVSPGSVQHGA